MTLRCIIFVLMGCLALVGKIKALGSMGPLGKIVVNSVYECKDELKAKGDEMKFNFTLRNIDDKGDKVLDVEYETKIVFDDNLQMVMDIKRFENGGWKKFYSIKGKACKTLNRLLKKLWNKYTAAFVPKLEKSCPIPAGSYKLKSFHALSEDLEMNTIFYGKLKVSLYLTDKNNQILLCVMAECESKAPY